MPSQIYLHDVGRKVDVDDSFFDMDETQQGQYLHGIVQQYSSMNPSVLEMFRAGTARAGQGIQNTLKKERSGSDVLDFIGGGAKAFGDVVGGTPETNRALDPNNPFAMPTITDVAADPIKNLPNYLAGAVGDALPTMGAAAVAASPLGRLGALAQAAGGAGAATLLAGLTDFGTTADSIANRNGRQTPSDDDYDEAIAVTGATSLFDGVASYYGIKSGMAKNLVLGAVSTGGTVGLQKVAATGELPSAEELLDSTLRGAVGAEGAARGIRAIQSIGPTIQRAQVGSEYSNNPDQVMSDARVGKLFQGRSGAEKQFDRGWDVNADETFKGIKADIRSHLEDLTDVSRRAGDVDRDQAKALKEITSRAAKHNHSLAEGGQDHAYFQTEIDSVRQMGLPQHTERAFVDALRDLETVSYNSMKKNAKGPAERVLNTGISKGLGGAIGAGLGGSVGGPTGAWIGAGIGGLVPGRLGRSIDTMTGSRQPPVLRRIEARNAYLKGKNIDPGDTVSGLQNAISDAQSRAKVVRPAQPRQGSPLSARLNEAGTPRIGGWQKSIIDNVNEALGDRVVGTKELHDTIDEAVTLGDLTAEEAKALKSRGNNEVDSQLMYDLSDIMAEKYGKGLSQDVPKTRTGDQGEPQAGPESGIRNEYAYRQTMSNVKEATQAALDGAVNPEMRSSITEIANARTPTAKKALLNKLLADNPDQADFINKQVGPITDFGPKDGTSTGPKMMSGIDPKDVKRLLIDPLFSGLTKTLGDKVSPSERRADSSRPTVREDGTIELSHYSMEEVINETNPKVYGRNKEIFPRSERDRMGLVLPRTYFGVNEGLDGGYIKEPGLGGTRHQAYVDPSSIYDIITDPDGLKAKAGELVREKGMNGVAAVDNVVKDAGYKGYWAKGPTGMVAQLFEKQALSPKRTGLEDNSGYKDTLLNVGLATNKGPKLTPSQVREAIRSLGVDILDDRTHFADHAKGGEDTLVAKLSRPLTKKEATDLSRTLRQEAIVQATDGTGDLYGPKAKAWGPFNPEYFKLLDGTQASEYVAEKEGFYKAAVQTASDGVHTVDNYKDIIDEPTFSKAPLEEKSRRLAERAESLLKETALANTLIPSIYPDSGLTEKPFKKGFAVDVAKQINARAQEMARDGVDLSDYSDTTRDHVASVMVAEALHAMTGEESALGWYAKKLDAAMGHASRVWNELSTDKRAQAAFKFITAVTSNGKTVPENSSTAFELYEEFRTAGRMNENGGNGKEKQAMNDAFALWNRKVDEVGVDKWIEFLMTPRTVREIEALGYKVNGELSDTIVPGSIVLGPKIGGAFFQNLMGNYKTLTMDRWWMKTWGRLTGTAYQPPSEELHAARTDRFKASMRGKSLAKYGYGDTTIAKLSEEQLIDVARQITSRDTGDGFPKGKDGKRPEHKKASQRFYEGTKTVLETPSGGTHRSFMRKTAMKAMQTLSDMGITLDEADFQALLWYPEKEFWQKYGKVNEAAEPTDYEIEFKKLADQRLKKGILDETFEQETDIPRGAGSKLFPEE